MTLLIDLLTADEEEVDNQTAHLRFDIQLLAERLVGVTDWLSERDETSRLKLGWQATGLLATSEKLSDHCLPRVPAPAPEAQPCWLVTHAGDAPAAKAPGRLAGPDLPCCP